MQRKICTLTKSQAEKFVYALPITSNKYRLPCETYMLDLLFTPWEPTTACQHPEKSWPWGAFQSYLSIYIFLHNQVSTPQQVWTATVPFSILPLILFLQETSNNKKHMTVPHVPSWNPPSPSWQGETLTHKPSTNICLWIRDLREHVRSAWLYIPHIKMPIMFQSCTTTIPIIPRL